jgi:hypothetical protein
MLHPISFFSIGNSGSQEQEREQQGAAAADGCKALDTGASA